jgi:hypothetical protein
MASQPPKKPLSFSFGKAAAPAKPVAPLQVQEKEDGPERVQAAGVSLNMLNRMADEASGAVKKELVIPMRPSKSFRAVAEAAHAAHLAEASASAADPAAPSSTDPSLSIEDAAAVRALLASAAPASDSDAARDTGLVIPQKAPTSVGSGAGTGSTSSDGGNAFDDLVDEPDDDDYDAVPIESFGSAVLRGMGWAPGGKIGLTNAACVKPRDLAEGHVGRLGLGADAKVMELKKQLDKAEKQGRTIGDAKGSAAAAPTAPARARPPQAAVVLGGARSVPLTVGCLVEMSRRGPHAGLFGRVTGPSGAANGGGAAADASVASGAAALPPGTVLDASAVVAVRLNISRAVVSGLTRAGGSFEVLDEAALPRDHQAFLDHDYWTEKNKLGPMRAAGAQAAALEAEELKRKATDAAAAGGAAGSGHAGDVDDNDYSDFVAKRPRDVKPRGGEGRPHGPDAPGAAPLRPTANSTESSSSSTSSTCRGTEMAPAPERGWRWVRAGLRVRLVSRSFGPQKGYKGVVARVSSRSGAAYVRVRAGEGDNGGSSSSGGSGGELVDVLPEEERGLETVVPAVGGSVCVLDGPRNARGRVGTVVRRDADRERVDVRLSGSGGGGAGGSDRDEWVVEALTFDEVCEYVRDYDCYV